jgi:hypothetical protein
MQLAEILDKLGYQDSPNFLRSGTADFRSAPDYGHIFRRAAEKCSLQGVYALRQSPSSPIVPVVYVCEASSEEKANEIHRRVWNQDVVPFLFVNTRDTVRLYSGFQHSSKDVQHGVIGVLTDFCRATDIVEGFNADAIDSGRLWRRWGHKVTPNERVDWKLLDNLKKLDGWLQNPKGLGLEKETSHALIGKYVYLHYLRGRDILSDKKFAKWNIAPRDVFGREATLKGVRSVVHRLDKWLNGSVFRLTFDGKDGVAQEHLQCVAATFEGDTLDDRGHRQLHLDFAAYDFSYIPIETLSVVYEQFLHGPSEEKKTSRARETGAYYTPIPVVNYILSELEERRPLKKGMRVFDPSCGSGAFLVQCYRRLIEKEFPFANRRPSPMELRKLLQRHIFGVDSDPDACSVTELSLILTLLDYVNPPDLEDRRSRFKLPELRDRNIFRDDFFREEAPWRTVLAKKKCGWLVGNPPWKKLNPKTLKEEDLFAWDWMTAHKAEMPVGDNQLSRAFAWRILEYADSAGIVGLLLPAKTLVDDRAQGFRKAFLCQTKVTGVANFANLRHVLFRGRAIAPAAAFFYKARTDGDDTSDEAISVYSPLVANQEATQATIQRKRNECWSLVINASEKRSISLSRVSNGDGLWWKAALWGSHLDLRLIEKLKRQFASSLLGSLETSGKLILAEGFQPKDKEVKKGPNRTEYVESILGKKILDIGQLEGQRRIFSFPETALPPNKSPYLRLRGGKKGLVVCEPPHIIVSAARTFAVYSDDYIIIPPRQIGIVSPSQDKTFLKALSLFLNSDFAYYHQFLVAADLGFERDRATPRDLRQIPIPLSGMEQKDLNKWAELYGRLVKASRHHKVIAENKRRPLLATEHAKESSVDDLIEELNQLVNDSLRLNERERAIIRDLVKVRIELNDGRLGRPAIAPPEHSQMMVYGERLATELNTFVGNELAKRYQVAVVYDKLSAMIDVDLVPAHAVQQTKVLKASEPTAREFVRVRDRLRKQCSQWVYFDRNFRFYKTTRTYILKPMQRFHWTESQAMCDASEIIAETLAGAGGEG